VTSDYGDLQTLFFFVHVNRLSILHVSSVHFIQWVAGSE